METDLCIHPSCGVLPKAAFVRLPRRAAVTVILYLNSANLLDDSATIAYDVGMCVLAGFEPPAVRRNRITTTPREKRPGSPAKGLSTATPL